MVAAWGALLAVGMLTGVWGWFRREPALPRVDLAQATPPVRRTLERHLEEVRRHPRSATAWGQLGSALYAYRLMAPAREALGRAGRLDPRNPRWPYLEGISWLSDDPGRAEARLRRAVEVGGNEPPALRLRLARLLAEQGRWEEVDREWRAFEPEGSVPGPALLLAAQSAREQGDLDKALAWARRATEQPEVARPAFTLLSTLLARQGDTAGATDAMRRAASASGSDRLVDPFDAEAMARREDPGAFSERVHPLLAQGRLDEAAAWIAVLRRDYSDYPDTWLAAGRHEYRRGNPAAAERHLLRHLELEERSVQGWFQLGMVRLGQRRDADAVEAFGRAVELKPDLAPAWHNRGLALGRLGRRPEAMRAFEEVLRLSPEHLDAYLLLADLHLQEGRRTAALELLDQARVLAPDDPRLSALRRKAESVR